MKHARRKVQYSVEFRKEVAEAYLNSDLTQIQIADIYGIKVQTKADGTKLCNNVSKWVKAYSAGLYEMSNTIAVSHKPKEVIGLPKTLIVNDIKYKQYVMPTDVLVIDDVTYIKV